MKHFYFTLFLIFTSATTILAQRFQIPYYDDFENGAPGWFASDDGQGTAWELGTPAFGYTSGAHSGMKCWDVNLVSGYQNNAQCYLYSPLFDFTYVNSGRVSFWLNYRAEYLWDYITVEYTSDQGDSWIFLPFPELISPDGFSGKWLKSSLNVDMLHGFPEVQFRFTFVSDGTVTYDGYSIDDFNIDAEPLGVSSYSDNAFSVYPNPSNGSFVVKHDFNVNEEISMQLFDITGRLVDTKSLTSSYTSFHSLQSGVYFLCVNHDGRVYNERIVIN